MMICSMVQLAMLLLGPAAKAEPPSKSSLNQIRDRGRELAAYDRAAWDASDELEELGYAEGEVRRYIARRDGNKWQVVFGRQDEENDGFLISYEGRKSAKDVSFEMVRHSPARVDRDFFLRASRAIDLAIKTQGTRQRKYNMAVLPARGGNWHVYLYPAPVEAGVWPLGGDVRYTISGDGRSIVETRQLHNSILDVTAKTAGGDTVEFSVHTHVLDCIPEDTDVFGVLSRQPPFAEYIICDPFSFAVDEDGTVRFIGYSEVLWGKKSEESPGPTSPAPSDEP